MKNKINIKVCGRNYSLMSEESQIYTEKLAAALDSKMNGILKASPSMSILDAAVLAALESYDELAKARTNIENIRSQIKGYVDEATKYKTDADSSRRKVFELEKKIQSLEDELEKRTVVRKADDEEVINARDLISQEIQSALKSPVHDPKSGM